MFRFGFVLLLCTVFACNNDKVSKEEEKGFSYKNFSDEFPTATVPYQLADSSLLKNNDTVQIKSPEFAQFIPDSITQKLTGKNKRIKYIPLAKISNKKAETYFLVKTTGGIKTAALLVAFDENGTYGATFPFLIPDEDPATFQNSSIDKNFNISRNVARRKKNEPFGEGKDVFVFNAAAKQFILIMTDALEEGSGAVINPIDTLPKTRRFAGDYVKGKRSIVSIRDGRTPSQAMAFVHLEKNDGACTGELKGELLFTSSTTAVYRQGGDPCILQFTFSGSTVTLKEERGCGNHRGLDCPLEGSFTRKKEPKASGAAKKLTKR